MLVVVWDVGVVWWLLLLELELELELEMAVVSSLSTDFDALLILEHESSVVV